MKSVVLRQLGNRGAVLIVGLFTLALLSLLGAAASTTSRTDVSINGNIRTIQQSFYAAEVGVAMGELAIDEMSSQHDDELKQLSLDPQAEVDYSRPHWKDLSWDVNDSNEVSDDNLPHGFDHLAAKPRYTFIEQDFSPDSLVRGIGTPSGTHTYSVYAKGTGGSLKTQTILESIFAKRFK